ncbi:MAG TPA: class I SAM-dependent methyltransferase [Candidatus Nitrosocosmicus sp.]|nr:class I SAM-dependent methyltransferase [Candidatus Nitrosocosmicus sp.]
MLFTILYIIGIFLVLLVAIFTFIYTLSGVVAFLMGAPYVPTKQKQINSILDKLILKKGQTVIELGSGDGRFIRSVVKKYNVNGIGIEIQPLLLFYSKLIAKIQNLDKVQYISQNFHNTDISHADVIFMYLLPNTLKTLKKKLKNECKKNAIIISHGFKIEDWDQYIFDKIESKPFSTYFYRLKNR